MSSTRTSAFGLTLFCFAVVLLVDVTSSSEHDGVTEGAIIVGDTTTGSDVDIDTYSASDTTFEDSELYSQHQRRVHSSWHQSHGRHRRAKDDGVCELEIFCGTGRGAEERTSSGVVRLPIRGQRGPPGPPGPQGEKGQKGQDGNGVVGVGQTAGNSPRRKVAFFAGLSENMGPVSENTDVKFDRLVTNVGGAYDEASGKFVAPIDGVYQFNVVISAQGRQKAAVMVLKNGEMVATVWAESVPSWGTSSNIAVLQLTRGDRVWVSLLSRASYLHGYMYTTFSGMIVFDM